MIAIPWYFTKSDSISTFGLTYMLANILCIFWVPYCGTFVDRYDRRKLYMAVTIASGLVLLLVSSIGYLQDGLEWFWVGFIFIFTFLNYNLHYPNLYAFLQEVTERKYYGRITSFVEIQGQLTRMAAGAFAAFLLEGTKAEGVKVFGYTFNLPFEVKPWQIHEIFFMDGMTYFLGFCIILAMRYTPLVERTRAKGAVLDQLKVGYDYLRSHVTIFIFGVFSFSIFITILMSNFFLIAVYVDKHLLASGDVYASAGIFYSVGALFAGLAIRRIYSGTSIPMAVIINTFLAAGLFGLMSVTNSVLITFISFIFLGVTNAGTRILRITFLFLNVPNEVFGRANSIFALTNIIQRIFFLGIFSMAFFQVDNHVIYAFAILSVFLVASAGVLIRFYQDFLKLQTQES